MWDPLQSAWRLRCPEQENPPTVRLHDFRQIERLAGAVSPAVYRIRFDCDCGERHTALLTASELDLDPVTTPLPCHHDLLLGRTAWAADELERRWQDAIVRGTWPLRVRCPRNHAAQMAWPSLLRAIEPLSGERAVIHYECPCCHRLAVEQWATRSLVFTPAL